MPKSSSWRQARMMAEQAQPDLPEGVERRVDAKHAMAYVVEDVGAGIFYDEQGNLKPEDECQ